VRERLAGPAQRVLGLTAGGGGAGFREAQHRLVLGVFADVQVLQPGQHDPG
jgi:hypothetical protein